MHEQREKQAEMLERLRELRPQAADVYSRTDISWQDIIAALEQFTECVRYLNTRRSKGTKLNLEGEDDVQDALYLMLRPWVRDLVYENPTGKVGNRFSFKDFLAPSAKTVIEAKYVRDESHGKQITKELHDDIEVYRHHPQCEHLVFFIYDPDSLIPDVAALEEEIKTERVYAGRPLYCHLIVRP